MGRPLRKLHQIHLCVSVQLDICNIRITRFRGPKHMGAQGFVSKNGRLEKADR
jgi:hypothetical protein